MIVDDKKIQRRRQNSNKGQYFGKNNEQIQCFVFWRVLI